ncbi:MULTISPECIES: DNA-binding protein NsdB [Kitasatospora]|uniref:Regulatory protein n=1 Tax=Kitasatospora cystarginea TaxID=58350 RepID=A0ABP5RSS4_9ACTN
MSKEPNARLADLFALTGWSKGELARLVNRRGAAMGQQQLSTDTSRVRRWIEQGEIPRDPVPRLLAAVFTERLGRVVTTEDLGLERHRRTRSGTTPSAEPWESDRTAAVLTEFTGMDLMLNRRGFVGASAALTAGAVIADNLYDWLSGPDVAYAAERPGPRKVIAQGGANPVVNVYEPGPVGADEVAALELSVEVFRAWDASRGGGLQRKAVVGQLNEVGGLLTHELNPGVKQRLWTVAANLSVLAGWMSHDVGLEPTAQRYFVIAAQAAREAGDRPRAGEAVSRAARQMLHLGRADDALELMQLAQASSGDRALPQTRAMLRTIEAWAQASLGRSEATRRVLGEAEKLFVQPADDPAPSWMLLFDEAELHGMQALVYRTLAEHDPGAAKLAELHARRAIEKRAMSGRERSALMDRITLASVYWISGEPDEAQVQAKMALAAINQTSSMRTWDRLREMYRLSAKYQGVPAVAELRDEIHSVMPPKPRTI